MLEIVELRSSVIELRSGPPTEAWSCVARKRVVEGQLAFIDPHLLFDAWGRA